MLPNREKSNQRSPSFCWFTEAMINTHEFGFLVNFNSVYLHRRHARHRRTYSHHFIFTNQLINPSLFQTKRGYISGIAQSLCSSTTRWQRPVKAYDANNTLVRVFQPQIGHRNEQWFYTVNCNNNQEHSEDYDRFNQCLGIDRTR